MQGSYVAKRLVGVVPLLIFISIISFTIIHLAPGGPAAVYLGAQATQAQVQQINHALGLDQPIYVQYLRWAGALLHGDLGKSLSDGQPVIIKIEQALPVTMTLALSAFVLGWIVGIGVGVGQALHAFTSQDYVLTVLAFMFISIPVFWLGLLLILFFTVHLGWLPSLGMRSQGAPYSVIDVFRHMVMPVACLATAEVAARSRYVRGVVMNTLTEDFVRTARAKGVPGIAIVYKHVFRNSLLPLITIFGFALAFLLSGSLLIEDVFALPGMGRLAVEAVFARDYPTVLGTLMLSALTIVVGNLIADILYGWADPRVRYR